MSRPLKLTNEHTEPSKNSRSCGENKAPVLCWVASLVQPGLEK